MDRHDTDLEERLLAARPEPRPDFVDSLEDRLLRPEPTRRSRWRVPLLGAGLAGGLTAMLLAFTLAGGDPFSSPGDGDVRARDCRFVETQVETVLPEATVDKRGDVSLRFEKHRVKRLIRRCR